MQSRIEKLFSEVEIYCPGLSKRFVLDNDTKKLIGTFYIKEESDRKSLKSVLDKFGDTLCSYSIYESASWNLVKKQIAESRFEEVEKLLVKDLNRVLAEARTRQGKDLAYSLSCWLDPVQGGLSYQVNCEHDFQESLERKQSSEYANLYSDLKSIQYYRYYQYSTFCFEADDKISTLLFDAAEKGYEYFLKYGDSIGAESSHRFELLTDTVARALRISSPSIKDKLLTSNNFVAYIMYYDQDDLTHYRAARKTMSVNQILRNMGELYGYLLE